MIIGGIPLERIITAWARNKVRGRRLEGGNKRHEIRPLGIRQITGLESASDRRVTIGMPRVEALRIVVRTFLFLFYEATHR